MAERTANKTRKKHEKKSIAICNHKRLRVRATGNRRIESLKIVEVV